jgi:hypothetical protein
MKVGKEKPMREMRKERKEQLNNKLRQIFDASGRSEDKAQSLLEEIILGHTYTIHEIKETTQHPPIEEYDFKDKDFTIIEFGLYQDGNACIETFSMPVSNSILLQYAARIDLAYYRWMQAEPQWIRATRPYEYYETVRACAADDGTYNLSEAEFNDLSDQEKEDILRQAETEAFLPSYYDRF